MIIHDENYETRFAKSDHDILGAQRLRYRVFVEEMGGDGPMVDHVGQFEKDRFDPYFDALILVDLRLDPKGLEHVVGVYRLMDGDGALLAGGYYSEGAYDLTVLRQGGRRLLELGRSCLASDVRGGGALFLLWGALARYIETQGIEVLFGVASFHGRDVGAHRQALSYLHQNYLAPPELRVVLGREQDVPGGYLPPEQVERRQALALMPPLIKAYLRLGGCIGEGAYIDKAFNTIDVCLLLDVAKTTPKLRRLYSQVGAT